LYLTYSTCLYGCMQHNGDGSLKIRQSLFNHYFHLVLSEFLFVPNSVPKGGTVELHLSGLIGTGSNPGKNKIRIIAFFFENGFHWQFEVRLLLRGLEL